MSAPEVSIILPTYDRLAYLQETVASVLAQTFSRWELIVSDDGSTDVSVSWLESLADPRITVLSAPHTGNRSRVRNRAVAHAGASWLAFIDSDDLWHPQKLALQLERLTNQTRCRWSCTGVDFIDGRGASIPQRAGNPYSAQSGWILEQLLQFSASATMPTLMVHRSLLDEAGGFDESILIQEDYDFELRLAAISEILAMEEALTSVRHHDGRTSSSERVSELHRGTEIVFRRAAQRTESQRVRELCSRECARQLVSRSRALSREGDRVGALRAAAGAVREQPFAPFVYRAAARLAWRQVRAAISF